MALTGIYKPINREKYEGNSLNIVYRSAWELKTFNWCDANPHVIKWSSEEIVVPYQCMTDNLFHRYFIDLKIVFDTGKTILVEIKPNAQFKKPRQGKKDKWKFLKEVQTYAKNVSKWKAAKRFAEKRGWEFKIWTEKELKRYGIMQSYRPQRIRVRGKNCDINEPIKFL